MKIQFSIATKLHTSRVIWKHIHPFPIDPEHIRCFRYNRFLSPFNDDVEKKKWEIKFIFQAEIVQNCDEKMKNFAKRMAKNMENWKCRENVIFLKCRRCYSFRNCVKNHRIMSYFLFILFEWAELKGAMWGNIILSQDAHCCSCILERKVLDI